LQKSHYLVRIYRISHIVAHLLYAVAVLVFIYPLLSGMARTRVEQRWNRGLMAILNIQFSIAGVAPDLAVKNIMLVANHVSWLDIYLLNAVRPVRFVSKIEVRSWPIIGFLASKTGTLFIDRSKRHDTKRVNHEVSAALSNGACVAVFPEGTTSDGSLLRPFHASLLQPAIHSHSKIWPAAIRYSHADGSLNIAPAYVDELTFGDSILLILSQKIIYAEIQFMPPIHAHGKERRELAREAEMVIARALNLGGANAGAEVPV
jgi:1-acyl-sn-glycerol-3-phosphate acyltransferase